MYIPTPFAESDSEKLAEAIERFGFATLVTSINGKPVATHLPLLLDRAAGPPGVLLGHVARANPIWRAGSGEALAIFQGPHAYISPTYYESENTVPTWNYVAVHVAGRISYFDDQVRLRALLRRMVEKYESPRSPAWVWNEQSDYSQKLLGGIVGVEVQIDHMEGAWKLNQNHPAERRRRVIAGLERDGGEDALSIAALMRERPGTLPSP